MIRRTSDVGTAAVYSVTINVIRNGGNLDPRYSRVSSDHGTNVLKSGYLSDPNRWMRDRVTARFSVRAQVKTEIS